MDQRVLTINFTEKTNNGSKIEMTILLIFKRTHYFVIIFEEQIIVKLWSDDVTKNCKRCWNFQSKT